MTRARLLPFCLLTLSAIPCASFAQSEIQAQGRPMFDSGDTVSVHRLSIPGKARKSYNDGVRLLNGMDWNASVPKFERAIKLFPGFYEAYNLLGDADLGMHKWDDARAAFLQALQLSGGTFAKPYFGLGLILSHQNQLAEAEVTIRQGLAINPEDPRGDFCLGWVLYSMGRLTEAAESARQAIADQPSFQEPFLLLAQIHLLQRNFAAEIADLNGYLALDSSSMRSARARAALADAQRNVAAQTADARVTP
jgi:tetratricopeptide (TPR) repeat protein